MEKSGARWRAEIRNIERPVWTDNTLLEITRKCYVGCNDCYKGNLVSSKGPHLDKETVTRRLQWIADNVHAPKVTFIGGEPLLHPDFQELVKTAQDMHLRVEIITAGQVSNDPTEQSNHQFMLDQVEQGK